MELTVQRDNLTPLLRAMLASARKPQEALEPMGMALVSMAKRAHTDASLRPHVWPAKKDGSKSTLQDTTTLRRAWRVGSVGKDYVTVVNDRPYAAVHHEGGTTLPFIMRPKNGKALKFTIGGVTIIRRQVDHPGSDIPKRRALPVEDDGRLTPHAERVLMGIATRVMMRARR